MTLRDNRSERISESYASDKVRQFIADGQRWIVREVYAPRLDRRGGTHLVFWGDSIMRRLRVFPANWFELSDEALYKLTDYIAR
jgi:hypothetical protein